MVLLEGNVYFPPDALIAGRFALSRRRTLCPWKGIARYYAVDVGGVEHRNAAWTYRHPFPLAQGIRNHVAFGDGATVVREP